MTSADARLGRSKFGEADVSVTALGLGERGEDARTF
jgi:hypothetical protein